MKNPNQTSLLKTAEVEFAAPNSIDNFLLFVPVCEKPKTGALTKRPSSGLSPVTCMTGTFKYFQDLTERDYGSMRSVLTGPVPRDIRGGRNSFLEAFMCDALSNETLVIAYFHPKRFDDLAPLHSLDLVPMTWALRFAASSQLAANIAPDERRLTYVAAVLYNCGLFHCSQDQDLRRLPVLPMGSACFAMARLFFLDAAMSMLRSHDAPLADTLAAILDMPHGNLCDSEQVARIRTAVHLASIRLTGLWTTAAV